MRGFSPSKKLCPAVLCQVLDHRPAARVSMFVTVCTRARASAFCGGGGEGVWAWRASVRGSEGARGAGMVEAFKGCWGGSVGKSKCEGMLGRGCREGQLLRGGGAEYRSGAQGGAVQVQQEPQVRFPTLFTFWRISSTWGYLGLSNHMDLSGAISSGPM